MKIVIPVEGFFQSGGCKILADIANGFVDRGHETIVVMPQNTMELYPIRAKKLYVPSLSSEWIPDGDAIITNYYTTFAPAFTAHPTKCIRYCQGYEPDWLKGKDREKAIYSYQHPIPTISISHFLRKKIYADTRQHSDVLNLGIEPEIFHPNLTIRNRRKFKKVIMYIAREPKNGLEIKGYPDFVTAMKRFHRLNKRRIPYIVHLICTDKELDFPSYIPHEIFRPTNAQGMARHYQTANLYVSSSHSEGFALPVLEAMACQTPVITTNSGGVLDFSINRKTALIVPSKKPLVLAKAIHWLLKRPKFAQKLAVTAYHQNKHLTVHHFVQEFIRWTERIVLERKRREVP